MKPFSQDEITSACHSIGDSLLAGMQLVDVILDMAELQPERAEYWLEVSNMLNKGATLSSQIEPLWPVDIVETVRAGETSGKIEAVLSSIIEMIKLRKEVNGYASQVIYPASMVLAGAFAAYFILAVVIPEISAAAKSTDGGLIIQASKYLAYFHEHYFKPALVFIFGWVGLGIYWLTNPNNRQKAFDVQLSFPKAHSALKKFYFAMWARNLATLLEAGVPIKQALAASLKSMNHNFQDGVSLLVRDIEKLSASEALNKNKLVASDPRSTWPRLIVNAFKLGDSSGLHDEQLYKASTALTNEARREMDIFYKFAHYIAMMIASASVAGALAMFMNTYFSLIGQAL